jgi:hypothetical protein
LIWPFSRSAKPARSNAGDAAPLRQAVEIDCAEVDKMMSDLIPGALGDGIDGKGRAFSILRYTSRTTGKDYDCVFTSGEGRRCLEWPPFEQSEQRSDGAR